MSDNQREIETIDELELVYALSVILKIPETTIFNFITKLEPNKKLYYQFFKMTKKLCDKKIRELHNIGRAATIKREKDEFDRKITSMTASFKKEIETHFKEENITVSETTLKNIDAFLYLVNSNYYDDIKLTNKSIRRKFLIQQLLFQISNYLKVTDSSSFDEESVKEVLSTSIFIPNEIKKAIISEFKDSKVKHNNKTFYHIKRKDIQIGKDSYLEEYNRANSNRIIEWKYDNEYNYITLIEALEVSEEFQELQIGSAKDLCWDLPFIQAMNIFIHDNYQDDLLRMYEEYSNFGLMGQFLFYTMAYAVEEEFSEVTSDVVLASFAEWPLLPFNLKLQIIDDFFEKENLTYLEHPFRDKKPTSKPYQKKIIPLKTPENKE